MKRKSTVKCSTDEVYKIIKKPVKDHKEKTKKTQGHDKISVKNFHGMFNERLMIKISGKRKGSVLIDLITAISICSIISAIICTVFLDVTASTDDVYDRNFLYEEMACTENLLKREFEYASEIDFFQYEKKKYSYVIARYSFLSIQDIENRVNYLKKSRTDLKTETDKEKTEKNVLFNKKLKIVFYPSRRTIAMDGGVSNYSTGFEITKCCKDIKVLKYDDKGALIKITLSKGKKELSKNIYFTRKSKIFSCE